MNNKEIKLYKHPDGYSVKRKNKRLVIRKSSEEEQMFVQIASYFGKEEGHFALTEDRRGIKVLTMKITHETAQILSECLTIYLQDHK